MKAVMTVPTGDRFYSNPLNNNIITDTSPL
jgi:hypothetical protein